MRLPYLVKKELLEVLRQRELLPLIFLAPVVQAILFGFVATTDVKNISVLIVDLARNEASQKIVSRVASNPLFRLRGVLSTPVNTLELLRKGEVKTVLFLRKPFRRVEGRSLDVQILSDGVDANTSQIAAGYLNGIVSQSSQAGPSAPIQISPLVRYNPELKSLYYMGPGIVALLLTVIGIFLGSMALVREKEQQTLDTLLISRLPRWEIYLGKAVPLLLIGFVEMVLATSIVILLFSIPVRGSLPLLFLSGTLYLTSIIAFGLFLSTLASTQQEAMFYGWFAMMTAILLSGFFTPLENIPPALRWITAVNPLRYFLEIVREIFLKGTGLGSFAPKLGALAVMSVSITLFSIGAFKRFVKR